MLRPKPAYRGGRFQLVSDQVGVHACFQDFLLEYTLKQAGFCSTTIVPRNANLETGNSRRVYDRHLSGLDRKEWPDAIAC